MNASSQAQDQPPEMSRGGCHRQEAGRWLPRLSPWRRLLAPRPAHLTQQPLLPSQGCRASLVAAEGHPE